MEQNIEAKIEAMDRKRKENTTLEVKHNIIKEKDMCRCLHQHLLTKKVNRKEANEDQGDCVL